MRIIQKSNNNNDDDNQLSSRRRDTQTAHYYEWLEIEVWLEEEIIPSARLGMALFDPTLGSNHIGVLKKNSLEQTADLGFLDFPRILLLDSLLAPDQSIVVLHCFSVQAVAGQ